MTLATSFDQRSPHRLGVTMALSAVPTSRHDLLGAAGDAAVHLAGAEHGVRLAALAGAAMDVARRRQVDEDGAGDAAERLAPADHAGDRLLVHAVLQRHDEAVGRQVLPDQHGRPGRVVGLHAHEGDVDRLLLGKLLHLGEVERAHRHGELGDLLGVRDAQPVLLHVVDVLGPGIDERHVLARLRHVRARISADRTRPDDGNLAAHGSLLRHCPYRASLPCAEQRLRCERGQPRNPLAGHPPDHPFCYKKAGTRPLIAARIVCDGPARNRIDTGSSRETPAQPETTRLSMCRNIKTLHNFAPPATHDEIRASALQFVRKLSGFNRPSKANERGLQPRGRAGDAGRPSSCSPRWSPTRRRATARWRPPRPAPARPSASASPETASPRSGPALTRRQAP